MAEPDPGPDPSGLADAVAWCGPTAALVLDGRGRITFVDGALERLLGRAALELVGREASVLLHPDDRGLLGAPEAAAPDGTDPAGDDRRPGGPRIPSLVRVRDADGSWRWLEATVTTTTPGDRAGPTWTVVHLYDVTRWRRQEMALREQVLHDPLTGAANRALFEDRLTQALLRGPRSGPPRVAVLFCDLDGFKAVNDCYGHATGDALLVDVFKRLRRAVRPPDTVARLGGDEFVVLCEDVDPDDAPALAHRILHEMAAPFRLAARSVTVSASVGIAIADRPGEQASDLVHRADRAMYAAKAHGRAGVAIWDDDLGAELAASDDTSRALRAAVDRRELELRWLPRVRLRGGRVEGTEAGVWWRHPVEGPVPASRFRGRAGGGTLDHAVAEWALTEVCRHFGSGRRDPSRPRGRRRGRVWVDLGPGRLAAGLVPAVRRALAGGGMDARRLGLHISGHDLSGLGRDPVGTPSGEADADGLHHLVDPVERGAALGALGRLGVHVSVDDLPGDPEALLAVRRAAVRAVNVPESVVSGVDRRDEHAAVARGLVSMAHSLAIGAHASGVTTRAQAEVLDRIGCDTASGPLFAEHATPAGTD